MGRRLGLGFLVAGLVAWVVLWVRISPEQTASLHEALRGGDPNVPVPSPETPPKGVASSRAVSPELAHPALSARGREATRPDAADDEQSLLDQVRALVKTDPARAEALARASRQRFPQGQTADERDALLVDALVNQQRIGAARDESYYYFQHHSRGRFGEHLFIMTGARPAPEGPAR